MIRIQFIFRKSLLVIIIITGLGLFVLLTSLVFNLFLFKIRGGRDERWERREGDITRDHWLVMSTGKLSAESPLGGKLAQTSHTSHFTRNKKSINLNLRWTAGPVWHCFVQTGIMSILLQKTMDKISNLCLGTHKNKWKLGISVVLEYVLYRSQVQYSFSLP